MKLLDKYLSSQVFLYFLFGVALVVIVWIAPELLPKVIREIVTGKIDAWQGCLIIFYELPEVLVKSLPMGMLIGTLLVFDRLSKESEITALRACGISIYRMLVSILFLGVIVSLIAFVINETIVPSTSLAQERIVNKGKLVTEHFTYIDKTHDDNLKQVVLINYFDGRMVKNIQIINFKQSVGVQTGIAEIITGRQAIWNGSEWKVFNGVAYALSQAGIYESNKVFSEMTVKSNINSYKLLVKSLKKAKNMNLGELNDYISMLQASQHYDEARYYKVRFHQQFSQPLAAIILGIVGLILGIHPPRSSRFLGYSIGMFVILLYYFVWPLSMALGNLGLLPPFVAAWMPNLIAVFIGLVILKYKDF